MKIISHFLVIFAMSAVLFLSIVACGGRSSSNDDGSDDPTPTTPIDDEDPSSGEPSQNGWSRIPSYIDPATHAGNVHYNSGGRRIVRINGTTLTLVNDGIYDFLYRSSDDGKNWERVDTEEGYSSTLISGPQGMVYHFARHDGDLLMVRFRYDANSIPAPVVIAADADNGSNHGAYTMLNATINEDGDLFVFWHHDLGGDDGFDTLQMIRSTDDAASWTPPMTVRAGALGDSWGFVHSDVTQSGDLITAYSEWESETVQVGISKDKGDTWTHDKIGDRYNGMNQWAFNPAILPVGSNELYVFAQSPDLKGLVFKKSTDSGITWPSSWTSIQANHANGYADPSPALGDDGTIYVAFRGSDSYTSLSDDLREQIAMSADGGNNWSFPDNHFDGGRVGTRSTMRYQTWHNYGGPLEWTWLEEDGEDTNIYPTMYDINADVTIHDLLN